MDEYVDGVMDPFLFRSFFMTLFSPSLRDHIVSVSFPNPYITLIENYRGSGLCLTRGIFVFSYFHFSSWYWWKWVVQQS